MTCWSQKEQRDILIQDRSVEKRRFDFRQDIKVNKSFYSNTFILGRGAVIQGRSVEDTLIFVIA